MATKPSDLLHRIPTVSELLEKPPVRALADRWNRSTVAAGVRSFLDELRNDLQRRASDAGIPSPRELAERAARHVVALQEHSQRPAINATGRIYGTPWAATPLVDAALERMFAVGRHFVIGPQRQSGEFAESVSNDAAAMLCRITGAQAAAVVHSYAGALCLTLAATAADREAIVARGEVGDVAHGCSLVQLARSAGVQLREIGATNCTTAANYGAALTPQVAAILRAASDSYAIVGDVVTTELESLVALGRERDVVLVDALGAAPLIDLPATSGVGRRSAQSSIAAGAGLVVVRGDGLVGGPNCGLILGRRDLIQKIIDHPLYAAWQLDTVKTAGLAATLECYEGKSDGSPELPLLQLLTTSVENLRNRAERLAPQLAAAADFSAVEAAPLQSQLFPAHATLSGLPSYGLALRPANGDMRALVHRIERGPRPVFGRVEGDRLHLDLRFVFPREDEALLEILLGDRPSESAA